MARRTIQGTPDQWQRVADAVVTRRTALGLSSADITGDGLSASVLSLIENNRQEKYALRTIGVLCDRLGWSPDSIERILNGEEPVLLKDAYLDHAGTRNVMQANIDHHRAGGRRQSPEWVLLTAHDVRLDHLGEQVDQLSRQLDEVLSRLPVDPQRHLEVVRDAAEGGPTQEQGPPQHRPSPPPEPEGP